MTCVAICGIIYSSPHAVDPHLQAHALRVVNMYKQGTYNIYTQSAVVLGNYCCGCGNPQKGGGNNPRQMMQHDHGSN